MNKKQLSSLAFMVALFGFSFYYWGINFTATILVLSVLIIFHEFGHFVVARYFGVAVKVFSLGFGESIYSKQIGATRYQISAIWLGGYVQLKGQNDANPKEKNYDPDSYNMLSPIKRIAILFAGPFFNVILAFLLYVAVGFLGIDKLAPTIGKVLPDSAALSAGLQKNDKVLEINGVKITHWDQIKTLISLEPTNLLIEREGKKINLTLNPKISDTKTIFGENIKAPMLGIAPSGEFVRLYYTGFSSIGFALDETLKASKLIYLSLEKLILGIVPINQLGGIVAMADITTKAASISISTLFIITALISVNLGVLNLLPLPVLDGGHIVFNTYEMLAKRPVNEKVFIYASYASMALLFLLMAFTIINDIYRLAGGYQ